MIITVKLDKSDIDVLRKAATILSSIDSRMWSTTDIMDIVIKNQDKSYSSELVYSDGTVIKSRYE